MARIKAIHQMLPGLRYGDAISNQALAIQQRLRAWGYTSEIYTAPENDDPQLHRLSRPYQTYVSEAGQTVIYHHCIGSILADFLRDLPEPVILYYHNITPPEFMEVINPNLARGLAWGREQLAYFAQRPCAWAGSEYNRQELLSLGYSQVSVLPYFVQFANLDQSASSEVGRAVLARYGDGCANWLFVGRIVPNKRQDDLIRTLAYYQHQIDPTARLLLVGSFFDTPGYHSELERLARRLAATNVEFCGVAPDDALGAYYRVATGYVSMSEHEGFGLPLLEAMHIGVPVIAYAAAAAPGTLGQAGVLIHRKRFEVVAELLWLIATDADLRAQLVARQRERVTEFAPDQVARHLRNMVESLQ